MEATANMVDLPANKKRSRPRSRFILGLRAAKRLAMSVLFQASGGIVARAPRIIGPALV